MCDVSTCLNVEPGISHELRKPPTHPLKVVAEKLEFPINCMFRGPTCGIGEQTLKDYEKFLTEQGHSELTWQLLFSDELTQKFIAAKKAAELLTKKYK